jgi:hypothetical protein
LRFDALCYIRQLQLTNYNSIIVYAFTLTAIKWKLFVTQFDNCNPQSRDQVWGLFGEQDTLAHFEPLFLKYYSHSFHFPGSHTPTAQEVSTWYMPLAEKLLIQ